LDVTKITISKEDVDKLYALHTAWNKRHAGLTKNQIKLNAKFHQQYSEFCYYLGKKYGYDPTKYLITQEGRLVRVNVTLKQ